MTDFEDQFVTVEEIEAAMPPLDLSRMPGNPVGRPRIRPVEPVGSPAVKREDVWAVIHDLEPNVYRASDLYDLYKAHRKELGLPVAIKRIWGSALRQAGASVLHRQIDSVNTRCWRISEEMISAASPENPS